MNNKSNFNSLSIVRNDNVIYHLGVFKHQVHVAKIVT